MRFIFSNTRIMPKNLKNVHWHLPSKVHHASSILMHKVLKIGTILQYFTHKLDPRVALAHKDSKAKSIKVHKFVAVHIIY